MVSVTFMVNSYYIYGRYYISGFYYFYGRYKSYLYSWRGSCLQLYAPMGHDELQRRQNISMAESCAEMGITCTQTDTWKTTKGQKTVHYSMRPNASHA